MNTDLIEKAATLLEGLLAGVFVGSCMIEHAARILPAQHWIPYNQAKDALYGPVMPVFFAVTLSASAVATCFKPAMHQSVATAFLLIAGIVTVCVNVPLNRTFRTWSSSDHPDGWADARRRWQVWNAVRCASAVSAFGVAVLG